MAQMLNPQRVQINFASSGDNTLVPALTVPAGSGMRPPFMYIWSFALVIGGASNLVFKDGGNPITGALPMLANGSINEPKTDIPHFVISPGNNFVLNSSNAVQVSGWVIYSQ
jgi:hypothetical protein